MKIQICSERTLFSINITKLLLTFFLFCSRLKLLTASKMSKLRFKIRRAFPQISRDWSLPASNLRMVAPSLTTTSKRSQHCIWSPVSVKVCKYFLLSGDRVTTKKKVSRLVFTSFFLVCNIKCQKCAGISSGHESRWFHI